MSKGDDLFEMISEEFPANVDSIQRNPKISARADSDSKHAHLFAFAQSTLPFIIGMTWVNENPESTTIQHSGGGSLGSSNREPNGIKVAAEEPEFSQGAHEGGQADARGQFKYDWNSHSSKTISSYVSRTPGRLKYGSVTSRDSERVVNLAFPSESTTSMRPKDAETRHWTYIHSFWAEKLVPDSFLCVPIRQNALLVTQVSTIGSACCTDICNLLKRPPVVKTEEILARLDLVSDI